MTRNAVRRFADSLLLVASLILAACSGAVSGPATTAPGAPLAISPTTATVYTDVPVKFVVTGGTAPYFITSSNAAVLPVPSGAYNYNELTVVPNAVGADTSVTISATDAKNSTAVSASLTVSPRTINSVVTVTPTVACGTALCPGGDATVKAVLSQNGVPLANRLVSFRVQSGDLRIIAPNSQPETLVQEAQVTTDSSGVATIRVRALGGAVPQTALLLITDLSSGFNQQASIVIGASTTTIGPLAANPSTVTFQGVAAGTCASGVSADVIVTGGKAPYQVSQPAGFSVSPLVVGSSGGRFTVTANGQCASGSAIAVVDSAGSSVSVTVVNKLSDATVAPTPSFSVAPTSVSLSSCNDVANVVLIGGSGAYVASSGNGAVTASTSSGSSGGTGFITRAAGPAPGVSAVNVAFSDGKTTQNVAVTLTGAALGACPATPTTPTPLAISPTAITLGACSDVANVSVSGGSGSYVESPSTTALKIGGSSSFFSVTRASSSAAVTSPQTVTVSDGSTTTQLTVNLTGPAAGTCGSSPSPSALAVNPASVTLTDCSSSPNVVISGGSGSYTAAASNSGIRPTISNNILTITRASSSGSVATPQAVTVSDGSSSTQVAVNLTGAATGTCPTQPPASALSVSPATVTISDCTSSPNVIVSGGTGTYSAAASDTGLQAIFTNNILSIRRRATSPAIISASPCPGTTTPDQCVTVTDGSSTTTVGVDVTPSGAVACP